MDHFGIGTAVEALMRAYQQASRGSGRTTSLVESVKDGDRIVFLSQKEADRVKRLCLERSIQVECIVISPRELDRLYHRGPSKGRTIFDHTWVEMYYQHKIEVAQREIDELQRQASGFGEADRQTRRKALEVARWRHWAG